MLGQLRLHHGGGHRHRPRPPCLGRHTDIRLVDHFAAEKINAGIAAGAGFATAFAGETSADLIALRETFRRKAFLGRTSALIEALREEGWSDTRILALSIGDLADAYRTDAKRVPDEPGLRRLADRYLELRASFGGTATPGDPAFRTADGEAIGPTDLPTYLRNIRMTRRSVEANGEMCRILLKARFDERSPVS